jgi:hypothetical protein
MTTAARLAGFGATLAVLFGGGALAGAVIDPDREEPRAAHAEETMTTETTHETPGAHEVRGLAVADDGLRLEIQTPELRRGRTETLRFRVVDDGGRAVRDFDVEHEKRMHLILARRDLSGFQHLHPRQDADGSWTTSVELPEAGSYRLFADFSYEKEPATLAGDLRVDGRADLRPLPAKAPSTTTEDGYVVTLDRTDAHPGEEAELAFTVTKDGKRVETQPYLGAAGHLVALRESDMAFLHVHPTGDGVEFEATFPSEGAYRLYLQFKHDGRVHTAEFTEQDA